MTTTYVPTAGEIAAKQRHMDSEMLSAHPAWVQRTSPSEAERTLIIENAAKENAQKYEAYLEQREKQKDTQPKPPIASKQSWAEKYERVVNEDKSVSYVRDGEEKIRDGGDGVAVLGNDKDSLRDAVRLAREKFGNEIHVSVKDERKRDQILEEMARQGVKPQEALMERYAEIKAEVEKRREAAQLSAPQQQLETDREYERE